jgi:hypothetical protein
MMYYTSSGISNITGTRLHYKRRDTITPNKKTDRHDITEILLKEKFEDTKEVIRSRKS